MKTGIELITQERTEQIEKHGYTSESDQRYFDEGQLKQSAIELLGESDESYYIPDNWNVEQFKRMMKKPLVERLIIAGAFIAAEIDRLNSISMDRKPISDER
jgi:hypothetical protein